MATINKSIVAKNKHFQKEDPPMTSKSKRRCNCPSSSKSKNNIKKQKGCEQTYICNHFAEKVRPQISEVEICIPSNLHKSLFGSKDCLIGSIVEECGKVHIYFPRNKTGIQKAIIRGPVQSVEKAKKKLLQLAEEEEAKNYSMPVPTKSQYHHFLINKNGGKLHRVFENPGTQVILPKLKNKNQESVTVLRTKAAGKDVQKDPEVVSKDLENVVEDSLLINRKFHHFFVMHRGQLLREMNEVYGGVTISFSYEGKQNIRVTMKGEKACVEGAKKHIRGIFEPLGSNITTRYVIPQKFHPFVLGPMCSRVRQIARDYKVQIKFPDSENPIVNKDPVVHKTGKEKWQNNGKESDSSYPRTCKILYISGQTENCHAAMDALDSLTPVTAEVDVPFHLYPYIIGQKSGGMLRKLINEFEVLIRVTNPGIRSDVISIMGLASDVEQAKIKLQKQIETAQAKIENLISRNFKLMFTLDPKYRSKITGHKGMLTAQICTEHDVTIHFPKKGSRELQEQIVITGYKENTLAARDAIMRVLHKIERTVSKDFPLNPHARGYIIGFGDKAIHKIMNHFQVDIRLPPKGSWNTNITVSGLPENVQDAINHIIKLEKYYLSNEIKYEPQVENLKCNSLCSIATMPSKCLVKKDVPCNANTTANPPDMDNSENNPKSKQKMSPKNHPWRP